MPDAEIHGLTEVFAAQQGVAEDTEVTDTLALTGAQTAVGVAHQPLHVGENCHFLPMRDARIGVLHLCQRKRGALQQSLDAHVLAA
ncbi:hypothetical protein D3C77_425830 [compost metagenome]